MAERHPRNVETQPQNPIVLSPALLRTPIADQGTLLVSRPWARWLQASWGRQGGAQAPSNAELDDGLTSTNEDLGQTQDDLSQTQEDLGQTNDTVAELDAALQALTTRVITLEGQVTTLETQVETLVELVEAQSVRLTALEDWRVAVVAALPVVVVVTAAPALTNDPATAILLENDLTANWRPPLNANDAAVASAVNAVRNALAA